MGYRKVYGTIEEDFEAMGIGTSVQSLLNIAGNAEGFDGASLTESNEDSYDGNVVTTELMERIDNLPLEDLSVEQIDRILEGIEDKDLPDGDPGLRVYTENVLRKLIEYRVGLTERAQRTIVVGGKRKRVKKMKMADKRKAKQYRRKRKSKIKLARKKWSRTAKAKKAAKKTARYHKAHEDVNNDLRSLVEDAVESATGLRPEMTSDADARIEVIDRIHDVFAEAEGWFEDHPDFENIEEAMEESLDIAKSLLNEDIQSDEDFVQSLTPVLKVIHRMMEEMEDEFSDLEEGAEYDGDCYDEDCDDDYDDDDYYDEDDDDYEDYEGNEQETLW